MASGMSKIRYIFLTRIMTPGGLEWFLAIDTKRNDKRVIAFDLTEYTDLLEKGRIDR